MSAIALPDPVVALRTASSSREQRAHKHFMTGRAHACAKQWLQAAQAYERAALLSRDSAYALTAAHAAIKAGDPQRAVTRLGALRRSCPALTLAYTLESHAWLALSGGAEALAVLEALPENAERDHAYEMALAMALQRLGRHQDALPVLVQALRSKIDDPLAHFHMGLSLKELAHKAEAAECVRTALALGLGSSELAARGLLVFLEREACRWAQSEAELATLRQAVGAMPPDAAVETAPFVHAVVVANAVEQRKVAALYARHIAAQAVQLPRRRAREHPGRLRVGYLSADFHQHATSQLMAEMLEAHDRDRFEVTLFSAGPDDGTALRQRMRASSEHFVELHRQGLAQMASAVRERQIDILVDVKGATHNTVLPVMAYRAAPVQVSWLGFPGTSGADYIDYVIGDPVVTPVEHDAHFSERIAQMPLCYQSNDSRRALPQPQPRAIWGLPDDATVLCAFHQSYKIAREVFGTWCRLLHSLPNAVLWLLRWNANVEAFLKAAAVAHGVDPTRLVFAPFLPADQHLSRLAAADLYLDAWPCNAHTTASEALWVGVPPVTIVGETFAQRVAASLLQASGLSELVCRDVAQYGQTVQALAADPQRRHELRARLVAQRSLPLFDGSRFARDIEALYERMWARAVAGLPPAHLIASSTPDACR